MSDALTPREEAAEPWKEGREEGRLAPRAWIKGDPRPAVGTMTLVSGVHGDIESDQHRGFSWRRVIGYGVDGADFICLQAKGCWPTVERMENCWFAALTDKAPSCKTCGGSGRELGSRFNRCEDCADKAPSAPAGESPLKRVMDRASLNHARTPGHPDAFLNAILDYTAGFYGAAREAGMPASSVADAMNHVERAARGLHALALRARTSEPEARGAWGYAARRTRIDGAPCEASWMTGRVGDGLYMLTSVDPDWQVITLYTHPSPDETSDKLRVAVEALEQIEKDYDEYAANGTEHDAGFESGLAAAAHRADQALATLSPKAAEGRE